jgi:hypothetical protein
VSTKPVTTTQAFLLSLASLRTRRVGNNPNPVRIRRADVWSETTDICGGDGRAVEGDDGRWQAPHPVFVPEIPLECGACHRLLSPIRHRFSLSERDWGQALRGFHVSPLFRSCFWRLPSPVGSYAPRLFLHKLLFGLLIILLGRGMKDARIVNIRHIVGLF